ncbi:MAG: SDR family NAD(P)-dependent oxidoreductase [Bdellovibrionota bacterium]|nr:MAG: SDR family NAD(P)-dependent oxidoreductase [Bdellovibrionota bacterium]
MLLSQHTIVITGATSGFGTAIAKRCAAEKAKLVLIGRRAERLTALHAELSPHTAVHTLQLDVTQREAVSVALRQLPGPFDQPTALINNAGLALGMTGADQSDLNDWETMVDTNIKGLLYCTHALLPAMVERNNGHIVNIGSVAGNWPYPGGNVYGATKAFVQQFSRNLRAELLGKQIRVTNIEPGLAQTEFSEVRFKGDSYRAHKVYDGTTPLSADDIADTVEWVLTRPLHVNINSIELMPTCQAWGHLALMRRTPTGSS